MQLWTVPSHAALFVWSQNWMACKRRGNISMHLQESAVVRTFTEYHKGFQGQEKLKWIKSKLKFDFFLQKVRYLALKNQALCLHRSQRNVNWNLIKTLVSAEYFNWNFQWNTEQLIPCSIQGRQVRLKRHTTEKPGYSWKCHMLNPFLVNILGSQIYIYTQKCKYFLSISRRKIALPVTYSMSKLRLKLLDISPQQ